MPTCMCTNHVVVPSVLTSCMCPCNIYCRQKLLFALLLELLSIIAVVFGTGSLLCEIQQYFSL